MNKIKFAFAAFAASLLLTSCMDGGYGSMDDVTADKAYGNDKIEATNVVTLEDLKKINKKITKQVYAQNPSTGEWGMQTQEVDGFPYADILTQYRDYIKVTDDVKLKLRVTGNDIGGNIYNKFFAQDENGEAIAICVYSGGMFSYLPVGQELLVDLKDLYIGTYGNQAQIGTPYTTSSGNTYPGRMANNLWQQHFKLLGYDPSAANCQPMEMTVAEFKDKYMNNIDKYAGRLITLTDAELTEADGTKTWAPESTTDFSISRSIKNLPSSVVVYTSTSAKFAGEIMPKGKVRLTGIFSRYGTTWQIQLRDINDVK